MKTPKALTDSEHRQTGKTTVGALNQRVLRKLGLIALLTVLIVALIHNFAPGKIHVDRINAILVIGAVAVLASRAIHAIPAYLIAGWLLIAVALVHIVLPGRVSLDWPAIVLFACAMLLLLLPQVSSLVPYVDKLKYKDLEVSLKDTKKLSFTVDQAEQAVPSTPAADKTTPLAELLRKIDTDLEAKIIDLASIDKESALVRLGVEIEKQITVLFATSGLGNQYPARNWREMLDVLRDRGIITSEIDTALREFWVVRNQVVHAGAARSRITDRLLVSTIDSGIRLLKLLKEIPRPTYRVHRANVALYSDPACTQKLDVMGVIIETRDPIGILAGKNIYPAGRNFAPNEVVGWDWNMKTVVGKTFYRDPDTGETRTGWDSSALFVGRSL